MTTPDLSRLSAPEREVLALLAQGHTAKSIAAATGRSEGAVNERLREARRKTGVGSSRELARLLARESRDEIVGVAAPIEPAPAEPGAPLRARFGRKAITMTIIIGGFAALAAALLSPGQRTGADDPLYKAASADWGLSPAGVRETMSHEARDAAWADATEAALRSRYVAVRGVDPAALRVTCRTSWCEVLGQSDAAVAPAALKAAAHELNAPAFRDGLKRDGLHGDVTGTNGDGQGAAYHFTFLGYWRRVPG